jgi:hypothetical protein
MTPVSPGGNRLTVAFWCHPNWQRRTRRLGLRLGVRPVCIGPAGFFRMPKNTLIQLKSLQNSRVCHVRM